MPVKPNSLGWHYEQFAVRCIDHMGLVFILGYRVAAQDRRGHATVIEWPLPDRDSLTEFIAFSAVGGELAKEVKGHMPGAIEKGAKIIADARVSGRAS